MDRRETEEPTKWTGSGGGLKRGDRSDVPAVGAIQGWSSLKGLWPGPAKCPCLRPRAGWGVSG